MVAASSLLALIILIGFFGGVIARRGHFPDLLVLPAPGLLNRQLRKIRRAARGPPSRHALENVAEHER